MRSHVSSGKHWRARVAAWTLLLLVQMGAVAAGPLMAVDFGGESIRVSVVKPGRTPISVVLNEASKRKTSAQVAFVDKERLLGDEAAALSSRYPDRVYARTRDFLGKRGDDEELQQLLVDAHLPYQVVPYSKERPTAAIMTHTGETYSAEELVGSILQYARSITEAAADGAAILDCVITVPAFWGPAQRQALVDAAKVAGISVLSLINSHAAAALQYGIERDFTNRTELIVLYDMGATNTECALVRFSSFTVKEAGKPKTYGQFEVLDVAWDATLGSESLDLLLLEHFAKEFEEQHPGLDPRKAPRAAAKLRRQVKRTKEVLSANSFAPISVEELQDGHDFRSRITREEFEGLAADFFARAAQPLKTVLEWNAVKPADLANVELLGGGSRVPAVKAALSNALGGRQLDMHLDADEAIVLGAGLFAANLSTTFRLRKFGMADGITYPIIFQLDRPASETAEGEAAAEGHFKEKTLLPRMKRLPARRVVHLPNTTAEPLIAHLRFNTSDSELPPGVTSDHLATFEITGIKDVVAKHGEPGKLSLHFRADESGLLSLDKAESVIETTEEYTIKVPVISKESLKAAADSADNDTDAEAAASDFAQKVEELLNMEKEASKAAVANETEANATATAAPVFKDVTKTRKKTIRTPLKIGGPGFLLPPLPADKLKASKKVLEKLEQADAAKREASKQKNELEAYIIAMRGRLEDDDDVITVTTEQQRTDCGQQLDAAEDWLYSEGEAEPAAVFLAKRKELQKVGDAISLRVQELKQLPKSTGNARDFVKVARQAISSWPTTKPWLNATDTEELLKQVGEFEDWLAAESEEQAKRKPHEDPVLLSAAVEAQLEALRKPFNKLKDKKKPKPPRKPKAPKAAANETADEKAESDADAAEEAAREEAPREEVPDPKEPQGERGAGEEEDVESRHDEL